MEISPPPSQARHGPSLLLAAPITNMNCFAVWICNYIHYEMYDEDTYTFSNYDGAGVEAWDG